MGIRSDLIDLINRVSAKFEIPVIQQIFMPEPTPSPDRDSEFGIVVLEDQSAGLYYAWMGESQVGMNQRYKVEEFIGLHPLQVVELYRSDDEADRSIGLAAVNAISQSVIRQSRIELPSAADSMGELDLQPGDHLGMVGFFPSLVRKLTAENIQLTIIEKKKHVIESHTDLNMTSETSALRHCNKILSTASTLLNDSLDEVLAHSKAAEIVVVVGPTAGFLPDPLFARGVSAIGGSQIVDVEIAIQRLSRKQALGDAARKYLLRNKRDSIIVQ
ncbi:MAG: hypothetical protein GKR93_01905 [Gammaproteobacteria bacterium]|nr:hypothetical protein [Gammaproteobacteria bacterium]